MRCLLLKHGVNSCVCEKNPVLPFQGQAHPIPMYSAPQVSETKCAQWGLTQEHLRTEKKWKAITGREPFVFLNADFSEAHTILYILKVLLVELLIHW